MMLRTHVAFGILIGLLSLKYLNVPNPYIFLAIVCLASVIPDVDSSQSKIGRKVKTLSWLIEKTIGHRNMFHSIFPLIIIAVTFFYFLDWNVAGTALLIGYGSHLFIDMFTYMGIALFHPLHSRRITGFVKTGGITDHILFLLFLLTDLVILSRFI